MDFLKDLSIDKVRNMAEDTLNQVKPKTEVEARVYEVLSHKNWGSSSSLMHEVARDTRDMERFHVITRIMWESMENQRPAAWRVVFKAMTLLEFLVKNGAERCVDDARNHGHVLRSLGQFNYYEGTVDRGVGVREKSKQILEILGDDERIREERQKARKLREKFSGSSATAASAPSSGGYGNQDSWNSGGGGGGGGYGDGGIDSGYGNGGGYSGRYGGSRGGPSSSSPAATSSAMPTFAAIPEKKKGKKKSSKKKTQAAVTAPAVAQPEVDLFSFDDAPSTAPAPAGNEDFGAFQTTTPATAPAPAKDDFADFGTLRSAAPSAGPDPFAAPAPVQPPQAQQQQPFDAFGNMAASSGGMNTMGGGVPNPPNNAMAGTSGMGGVNNAFANMSMGTQQPQPTSVSNAGAGDDDFGDFADAGPRSSMKSNPADPTAKLVSLDHLAKNPSQDRSNNSDEFSAFSMNQLQSQQASHGNNNVSPQKSFMVSAGGSDAISSMMGPPPASPQMQQGGMGGGQQRGSMNSQTILQMNPQMMANMQQGGMVGQQQQMNPQMMANMQQQGMGGMQGGMNQSGMQGNMAMGGMNQMGMQGNNMNMMGNQMNNQMGMQGNNMNNMMGNQQQWR